MDISVPMDQYVMVLNAVRDIDDTPQQFKLKHDFSQTKVDELLQQAAQHFELDPTEIYFMCWGRILEQKNSLESYGIKNGTLMILHEKTNTMLDEKNSQSPITSKPTTETGDKSCLVQSYDMAFHYRKELKYLNKHSFPFARCLKTDEMTRDKFLNKFPELTHDPSLFAVFTEISTISALLDAKYLESTLKRYPSFLQVTEYFIDLWKDEVSKNPNPNAELNNLFFLTDDEEEPEQQNQTPSSSSSQNQQQQNLQNLQNEQIRQMQQRFFPENLQSNGQRAGQSRRQAQQLPNLQGVARNMLRNPAEEVTSGSRITPEMLRNALQSSMPNPTSECQPLQQMASGEQLNTESSTPSSSSNSNSGSISSSSRAPTLAEQLSRASSAPQTPNQASERSAQVQTLIDRLPQLQALRELGITDEIVAIQALEAANGDLEMAINIIFSEDN